MPNSAYVAAFLTALIASLIATPAMRSLALRFGMLAKPSRRSVHSKPTPYLGGVAIYLAFALSTFLFLGVDRPEVMGLFIGGFLMVALGTLDDLRPLSPKVKLLGQVVCAAVVTGFGVQVAWVTNPFGGMFHIGALAVPVTVLWIVAVTNVVNLIDGLDGLAAGISSIAALTLLFVALRAGQAHVVLLTAALAGSSLGFLPYNFNPAKIFMGDAGSMFLGFALGAVAVEGTLKTVTLAALSVAILALGLPIFDTSFAIVRRVLKGRPFHQADREHIHHRLLRLGLNQRQAVLLMYLVSAALGVGAVLLTRLQVGPALLLFVFLMSGLYLGAKRLGVLDITKGEEFEG